MADCDGASGEIASALRDLLVAWDRSAEGWRDQQRQDFERSFIDPLQDSLEQVVKQTAGCASLLQRVRRDCTEDRP